MTLARRWTLCSVGLAVILSCRSRGSEGPVPGPTPDVTIRAETLQTQPVVEMHCSETRPGTEVATVRVRPRAMPPDSARLEFTVFKDGFATQRFASVIVTRRAPGPRLHVHERAQAHARVAFAIDTAHVATRNDSLVIHVENLEPGLTYYWRFVERVGNTLELTQPTRIQAPTCHRD